MVEEGEIFMLFAMVFPRLVRGSMGCRLRLSSSVIGYPSDAWSVGDG